MRTRSEQGAALGLAIFALTTGAVIGLACAAAEAHARGLADWVPMPWLAAAAPLLLATVLALLGPAALRLGRFPGRARARWLAGLAVLAGVAAGWLVRVGPPAEIAADFAGARGRLADLVLALPPSLLAAELATLAIGVAIALACARDLLGPPLCAHCRTRSRPGPAIASAAAPAREAARRIRARDWPYFRALGAPTSWRRLEFRLASCRCAMTRTVGVVLRGTFRRLEIATFMRLGADDVRTIRAFARDLESGAAIPAPVAPETSRLVAGEPQAGARPPPPPPIPFRLPGRPSSRSAVRVARTEGSTTRYLGPALP